MFVYTNRTGNLKRIAALAHKIVRRLRIGIGAIRLSIVSSVADTQCRALELKAFSVMRPSVFFIWNSASGGRVGLQHLLIYSA